MRKIFLTICPLFFLLMGEQGMAQASPDTYLADIKAGLNKKWPDNRTVNLVFHGHSVPSGYANTPHVHRPQAYPFLTFKKLQKQYPYSVVNSITTAIGGENSAQGEKRFKRDVLPHKPDVLFIDYALNDRRIGLEEARRATERMIRMALGKHIKVILITPSPDLKVDITKPDNILEQHTNQLIALAEKYQVGLVNSYQAFVDLAKSGKNLQRYMAQYNHPNERGHEVIANEIMKWFE